MAVTEVPEATEHPVIVQPWDEPNRALVANVHPPDWVNPEPAPRYNLVRLSARPGLAPRWPWWSAS